MLAGPAEGLVTVQLRDEAVLLEPDTRLNENTEEQVADWTKPPVSVTPTRFKGEPVSSTEEALTAETIVSRWVGYLPPMWDGILTPAFRIRWDGEDYLIDGAIERFKTRKCVRYLMVILKRVDG